jgi:hypothetical protein
MIVVDDFYPDPMAVRRMALDMDYDEQKPPIIFPGRNSARKVIPEGVDAVVSAIVGEPVSANLEAPHGNFRVAFADDDNHMTYRRHVDMNSYWSGILSLTLPGDDQEGTKIFAHKELGDWVPTEEKAGELGFDHVAEAVTYYVDRDTMDDGKWDLLMTVPMRFNRLILMRSQIWHEPGRSFGDCLDNGRLVHLMIFLPARPPQ